MSIFGIVNFAVINTHLCLLSSQKQCPDHFLFVWFSFLSSLTLVLFLIGVKIKSMALLLGITKNLLKCNLKGKMKEKFDCLKVLLKINLKVA